VRIFSRSHSPPPSTTGTMWSASQRVLRDLVRIPQKAKRVTRLLPREERSLRAAAIVSTPQEAQTPRSRWSTCSRRYAGCVRSFHSCTQNSEQNVERPRGTSRQHHRQRPRPLGPRAINSRSIQPPFMARRVLTGLFVNHALACGAMELAGEYTHLHFYLSGWELYTSAAMFVCIRIARGRHAHHVSGGRSVTESDRLRGVACADAECDGRRGACRR